MNMVKHHNNAFQINKCLAESTLLLEIIRSWHWNQCIDVFPSNHIISTTFELQRQSTEQISFYHFSLPFRHFLFLSIRKKREKIPKFNHTRRSIDWEHIHTHTRAYKYVSRHYNVNLNRAVTTQLFTFITLRRRRRKNGQHPFDHFQSYSAVIESQNFFIFFSSIDSSCRRCQRTPSWERTVNN